MKSLFNSRKRGYGITIKIACIGAGNRFFSKKMITDIVDNPAFSEDQLHLVLMDWNESRVKLTHKAIQSYLEADPVQTQNVQLEYTADQRAAITDAKYIITTFATGGLEAAKIDMEIAKKYGIEQTIGDTAGPGGLFRFLRNVPVYRSIIEDINEVGYNAGIRGVRALHFNYTIQLRFQPGIAIHYGKIQRLEFATGSKVPHKRYAIY